MRNSALPYEGWPSVRLDQETEQSIIETIELISKSGFNEIVLWGLFAAYSWPLDLTSAIDSERALRIERIIQAANRCGIKILTGIGIYSWGFDTIIESDPEVRGTNLHAMCGSKPESWEWMKKIIDFVIKRFDFDGLHLESADLGRCNCTVCDREGDVEYHSRITARAAQYIREQDSSKILLVSLCGYIPYYKKIAANEIQYLIEMSKHIDYLIDGGHNGYFIDETTLSAVIEQLHCDFGTSGGIWLYPPQRWERLRWFLPYTQKTGKHIKQLYHDGGRAIEYYLGPIINPGVEMNIAFGGRLLSNVDREMDDILAEVVTELYQPMDTETCASLVSIFKRAENAYFDHWYDAQDSPKAELRQLYVSEFYGNDLQKPTYLAEAPEFNRLMTRIMMDARGRERYRTELNFILADLLALEANTGSKGRMERLRICIQNVIKDIDETIMKSTDHHG